MIDNYFKRFIKSTVVLSGLIFIVLMLIFTNVRCKNPNDYKPPEDTLNMPPAPPQLLSPIDYYVRMPDAPTGRLLFVWQSLKDAELYEIFFSGDSYGEWAVPYDTNCFSLRLEKEPWQYMIDKFTWKVRTASAKWQCYTEWSAPRHFEVRFKPPPPESLSPSDSTDFILDSLPATIGFSWNIVQDEQYYDIEIILDSIPATETRVYNNSFQFVCTDTGTYSWHVRAGSQLWQYSTDWSDLWTFRVDITNP